MINQTKNKIGKFQLMMILFVWVLIFAIPLLFNDIKNDIEWNHIYKIWTEYFIIFLIFLINRFYLVPNFLFKNQKSFYFISLLFALLILFVITYFFDKFEFFTQSQNLPHPPRDNFDLPRPPPGTGGLRKEFIPPYANLQIIAILLIGFDTGLLISVKWLNLEQNKLQLEKENVTTKMAFLQNQISPHFFMNTLNNIHALVDINSEDAKEAIIKLSRMMGYVLYEKERVSIQKEMNFVHSFVDLMKIRFTDDVTIELNVPKILPTASIPTLLTISFIENAFKHGISYEENSFVKIYFSFTEDKMLFEIQNSIHTKAIKNENSGLGIENTRNRLNLIYGSNYNLTIEELPEKTFKVKLIIPI